jgi:tRNA A37 methylthiotransferase MiaB
LFSYPPHLIIERIKKDVSERFKEMLITSQDNACYGKDIATSLPQPLNEFVKLRESFL